MLVTCSPGSICQHLEKHGAKLNINSVIQRTIKTLIGLYAEKMQDVKVGETQSFKDAYDFRVTLDGSSPRRALNSVSLLTRRERSQKNWLASQFPSCMMMASWELIYSFRLTIFFADGRYSGLRAFVPSCLV